MVVRGNHLLRFGALAPAAHLAAGCEAAVHGEEAHGHSQGPHYHLPWVGSHQQAMEPEQAGQHVPRGR